MTPRALCGVCKSVLEPVWFDVAFWSHDIMFRCAGCGREYTWVRGTEYGQKYRDYSKEFTLTVSERSSDDTV